MSELPERWRSTQILREDRKFFSVVEKDLRFLIAVDLRHETVRQPGEQVGSFGDLNFFCRPSTQRRS